MKPRVDATGMVLVARKGDQFTYRTRAGAEMPLTHEQRVNHAKWVAVLRHICPGTEVTHNRYWGLGLNKHGAAGVASTLVHCVSEPEAQRVARRLGHPTAVMLDRKARKERHVFWMVKLALATKDWTEWPKVKGLRAPRQVQPKPPKAATLQDKWQRKRKHALAMTTRWERRQRFAEDKVKKWSVAARRAERKLQQLNSAGNSAQPTSQGE